MFCKGALLKDPKGILQKPGEANTQAARQIRFSQLQEIVAMEPVVKAYIKEAIAAEESRLESGIQDGARADSGRSSSIKLDESARPSKSRFRGPDARTATGLHPSILPPPNSPKPGRPEDREMVAVADSPREGIE